MTNSDGLLSPGTREQGTRTHVQGQRVGRSIEPLDHSDRQVKSNVIFMQAYAAEKHFGVNADKTRDGRRVLKRINR